MSKLLIFSLIMLCSVFVSACSQIILKKSAGKEYPSKLREYLNLPVISAYGLFFLSSLVNVLALKYVPLSVATLLETTGYVFVSILGFFILKEKISRRKLIGMAVIIAGVLVATI